MNDFDEFSRKGLVLYAAGTGAHMVYRGMKYRAAQAAAGINAAYKGYNFFFPKKDSMPPHKNARRSNSLAIRRDARGRFLKRAPSRPPFKRRGNSLPARLDRLVLFKRRKTTMRAGAGSMSSGRFRKGRKVRRGKGIDKMMNKGVVTTLEYGNTMTTDFCGYIGHTTMPLDSCTLMTWLALFKNFITVNLRLSVGSATAPIAGLRNGSIFKIEYYTDTYQTYASTSFVIGTNPVSPILNDLAVEANNWASASWTQHWRLFRLSYSEDGTNDTTTVSLLNSRIQYRVKSALKIQNRSSGPNGDEADDVDNIPLYGKSYDCKGNGMIYLDYAQAVPLISSDTTGRIEYAGTGNLKEPPPPTVFDRSVRSGKVRLEPGSIKTSVLTENSSMDCSRFFQMAYPLIRYPTVIQSYVGKSRIFAFEKILETETIGSIDPMLLAYEINTRYEFAFKNGWTKTVPMFINL